MSNEQVKQNPEIDPLAEDVSKVDTSFPLVQTGLYDVEIFDATKQPSKSNPEAETLKLSMKLTTDATDTKGGPVNKGFPLYHYIAVTPTQGGDGKQPYTSKDIAKKIASVAQVCGMKGVTARQLIDDPSAFEGHIVRVKVGISKETADYPESNVIKQFVPVE